jgi:hypothetical protein
MASFGSAAMFTSATFVRMHGKKSKFFGDFPEGKPESINPHIA